MEEMTAVVVITQNADYLEKALEKIVLLYEGNWEVFQKNIKGLEYLERHTVSFLDVKTVKIWFLLKIILKYNMIPVMIPVEFLFWNSKNWFESISARPKAKNSNDKCEKQE